MGRFPGRRAPRRRRGGDRQPHRQDPDPVLSRAGDRAEGQPAGPLRDGRRDRHRARRAARLRPADRADPSRAVPRRHAGADHPRQLRRLRSARTRRRGAPRHPARRPPHRPRRRTVHRSTPRPPRARDHRSRPRAGVVRAVRGRRARRGDRQTARSPLPARCPPHVQDQARAYGRRRHRGLPFPQERSDHRIAAPGPPRRPRGPPARGRLRRLPHEAPRRAGGRARTAADGRRHRPPVGRLGRGVRPRERPAARRAEPLDRQEGPLLGAAAPRARLRGGVRPHGGRPLPAHRPVPPLAADRTPESCTYAQLEEVVGYDLADVLGPPAGA